MNNTKVALITGASRGIGRVLAEHCSAAGFRVVVAYHQNQVAANEVVSGIVRTGGAVWATPVNVADPAACNRMCRRVVEQEGRIDLLINNAGVSANNLLANISERSWDQVVDVCLKGTFSMIRACAEPMMKQKSGAIINIASIAGARGLAGSANYAAAKGGVIALTKTAAKELGCFGITVNAVLPGFHATDMGKTATDTYRARIVEESVLHTTTDINELARFVVLLAQSTTVSGQVFNWDSRIV